MQRFLSALRQNIDNQALTKLTLSKPTENVGDLKNVYARLVLLKTGLQVQFTLRYKFRDVTKNLTADEAVAAVAEWLNVGFKIANLHTQNQDCSIEFLKNDKIKFSESANKNKQNKLNINENSDENGSENRSEIKAHDHQKQRRIAPENSIWLHRLGITNQQGAILKDKQSKFKQIDKYLEIIDSLLQNSFVTKIENTTENVEKTLKIADMGAGKGYLTFALYDFLQKKPNLKTEIIGVETRPDLIKTCNAIAEESGFEQLHFVESTIENFDANAINMFIALHACDTATDDALAKGIAAKADIIVVAPCCHKQVRRAMQPVGTMQLLLQNGIHVERQAELVTDSLRALLLESEGYTVKVQEFIALEHTGKNILITAVKNNKKAHKAEIHANIDKIMLDFGIKNQYLYDILKK